MPNDDEWTIQPEDIRDVAAATPGVSLDDLLETLQAAHDRRRFRKFEFFKPYAKQKQFLDLGATKRERLLMAGNQNGKSETGAYEYSLHMTGIYPEWWAGRRWNRPVRGWIDGETGLLVRDVQQKKLCGSPGVEEDFGTGMIPKEAFVDKSLARGVTDAYDTIQVKHYRSDGTPDGVSTATFKSYEQGRTKHQGEPVDLIWCDEEPPEDIYSEIVTRTTATNGIVYTTFTPLKGMSEVVRVFLEEKAECVVTMTIYDAEHITPEQREEMIRAWPAHERDARARGIPMLGSGRIFPYSDDAVSEPAIQHVPAYWGKLWGIDFGIDHPFAAVLILWDRDNDVIHVHHGFKVSSALPLFHASQMKMVGASVPVAWPQDGTQRDKGSLKPLANQYKETGLRMLDKHATWPDGSVSTEAAILEMQQRIETGRLKVAEHLEAWFDEYRTYHRKDGVIVKLKDDLLSATQKALMMKRHAQNVALGSQGINRRRHNVAEGLDFDLF